jgi:hypothetical protein
VPQKPDEFHYVVEKQSTAGNEGYDADQNAGIINAKGSAPIVQHVEQQCSMIRFLRQICR